MFPLKPSIFILVLPGSLLVLTNLTKSEVYESFEDYPFDNAKLARVSSQVMDKMTSVESTLVLKLHRDCNLEEEQTVDNLFKVWKNFSSYFSAGDERGQGGTPEDLQTLCDIRDILDGFLDHGSQFCNRKKGYCCSERTSKCVCPRGTTVQDSTCRILAGHECDLVGGQWSLHCVNYANCRDVGRTKGICTCKINPSFGMSICEGESVEPESPSRSRTEPESQDRSRVYPESLSRSGMEPEPLSRFRERNRLVKDGVKTSTTTISANVLTHTSHPGQMGSRVHQLQHVNEVDELLLEMMTHRVAVLDDQCFIRDNNKFHEIIQTYSDGNTVHDDDVAHVNELNILMVNGGHFCDLTKHLVCSPVSGTCQCPYSLYPNPNGECRIPEDDTSTELRVELNSATAITTFYLILCCIVFIFIK